MPMSPVIATQRSYHSLATPRARVPEDIRLIGVTAHLSRDQEVFGEGEPADQVFKVVHGAVRSFRVLSDGRRQICDFYLPGDVFGIEPGAVRQSTAEALTATVLVAARRSTLLDDDDRGMTHRLWGLAMADLQRSRDHALTLGRRSANERVASFIVDMAARLGDADNLELPMTRQDIADYLGLTIETVSRTLGHMQVSGLIRLAGCRSVHLRKPRALAALCA